MDITPKNEDNEGCRFPWLSDVISSYSQAVFGGTLMGPLNPVIQIPAQHTVFGSLVAIEAQISPTKSTQKILLH